MIDKRTNKTMKNLIAEFKNDTDLPLFADTKTESCYSDAYVKWLETKLKESRNRTLELGFNVDNLMGL